METIRDIQTALMDFCDIFLMPQEAEAFSEEPPFPSILGALLRLLLKYFYISLPVLWILMMVLCIIEELPVAGVILIGILATLLALLGLALVFLIGFVIESFAKQITSLILYGKPSFYISNSIDAILTLWIVGSADT